MAEPDQAGVVIHGLRNEFTVNLSVNGLRRPSGSFAMVGIGHEIPIADLLGDWRL